MRQTAVKVHWSAEQFGWVNVVHFTRQFTSQHNIDIHGLFSKFETFLGERADKTKREKVLSLNALYYVPLTTPRDD